jgi:hypothetical protein
MGGNMRKIILESFALLLSSLLTFFSVGTSIRFLQRIVFEDSQEIGFHFFEFSAFVFGTLFAAMLSFVVFKYGHKRVKIVAAILMTLDLTSLLTMVVLVALGKIDFSG